MLETAQQREAFFMVLYQKVFPGVARYVAKMGGNQEEAQDIFQDSLLMYYEKIASGKAGEAGEVANPKAYIAGIAKKLWLHRYRSQDVYQPLNGFDTEALPTRQPNEDKLMHYLYTAGNKCMQLLQACYYHKLGMGAVASRFGYTSIHSATVAKYKCLEKIRDTVKKHALTYADFFE